VSYPRSNSEKSARFVSNEILSRFQPGEKMAVYGIADTGPYNYYTGIVPILELESLKAVMGFLRSENRVYCLLWYKDLITFQTIPERPPVEVISRQRVGHRDIVLVSHRKDGR